MAGGSIRHTSFSFVEKLLWFSREIKREREREREREGERVNPCSFVVFNIIIRHVFPEDFIEIRQVDQNI